MDRRNICHHQKRKGVYGCDLQRKKSVGTVNVLGKDQNDGRQLQTADD